MSVCLKDLMNGVSELLLSHTTLLGKSPKSILCFFFLEDLRALAYKPPKISDFNPTSYNRLQK